MKVFRSEKELKSTLLLTKESKKRIGFVPTMGALHEGHISLIEKAKKECDEVICSVFVNPTQFDNKDDLIKYPITIEEDLKLLEKASCDIVFVPSVKEMYPRGAESKKYDFGGIEKEMEGAFRIGHFDGVGTIVHRFFDIIKPDKAFFGEKDFQQLQIIKKLVEIEKLPIEIIGCPIFREQDGLAMSSRNRRLTIEMRNEAPIIYRILKEVQYKITKESISDIEHFVKQSFNESALDLEYFLISDIQTLKPTQVIDKNKKYRAFVAAFANDIRLIDNIAL
ncbi:pantoate--beta-alanine ligase (AMP-forming) [Flavobacteriaceae bacterium UJ101]|nr:pantoate--beta-alanine ligase (AMP-forming) [Flavobacteriaceae bacterium UJ101]